MLTPIPPAVIAPKRSYVVTLQVTLDCDEDVITRTQRDGWADQMYDLTEDEAAGMLGRALLGRNLSSVDGWADMRDEQADVSTPIVIDVERLA
jgi:hypothetical protein